MHKARFLRPRLARQNFGERRLPLHQLLQRRLNVVERLEVMHELGTPTQLTGRLRTAQQKHAKKGTFSTSEVEYLLLAVLIFRVDAIRSSRRSRQAMFLQAAERIPHSIFVK